MGQAAPISLRFVSARNLDVIDERNNRAGSLVIRAPVVTVIWIVRIIIRSVINVVKGLRRVIALGILPFGASTE